MNSLLVSRGKTPRKGVVKVCPVCGGEFYTQQSTADKRVCCSRKCRDAYQQRRATKPCETCGAVFSRAQSYCARFCSRTCYLKSREPDKQCAVCGKQLPKVAMTYCSYECNLEGRRNGSEKPCKVCGKMMYVAAQSQKSYCSRDCAHAAMRGNGIKGPGSKFIRSDGYMYVYYPAHPDVNRSGYVMEHRLVAEAKYGRRIGRNEHVHHIDGDRLNNDPENLEIRSPSEHSRISSAQGVAKRRNQREKLAEYERRFGPLD